MHPGRGRTDLRPRLCLPGGVGGGVAAWTSGADGGEGKGGGVQ